MNLSCLDAINGMRLHVKFETPRSNVQHRIFKHLAAQMAIAQSQQIFYGNSQTKLSERELIVTKKRKKYVKFIYKSIILPYRII